MNDLNQHYRDLLGLTDPDELARLERGEFTEDESVGRPCSKDEVDELRQLGRLESDEGRSRRERAEELKSRLDDCSAKSTTGDIASRFGIRAH